MTTTPKPAVIAPRQICPLCGFDDDVTVSELSGNNSWQFRCTGGNRYHAAPYFWDVAFEHRSTSHEGICAELGLYDDLPGCVPAGQSWVEHGIVEYLYKKAHPDTYRELVDRYGHIAKAPKRFTASVILALTLGRLADEGVVAYRPKLPATGFWSYNGTVGNWAPLPPPAGDGHTTWSAWAIAQGLDPQEWDLP